jgi:GNAT superfamily N-acetyltransferase
MGELRVTSVQDQRDLMAFITLPWEVYRGDPYWVPPPISERVAFLDRQQSPFFEHARAEYFLARRGERVVGTIAAFTNDLYNQFHETNVGFFGFFEVLDDSEAAAALLETAVDWARHAGHTSILGPEQFSTNDELGLLVDGFQDTPRILMTYNPPRYATYLERAGFTKAMDLWAYSLSLEEYLANQPKKLFRVTDKVLQRGHLHVRSVDMKHFDEEVAHVKEIYNRSWEKNWGFVPMTDAEFDRLAEQMRQLIDPDLVVVVEHDGQVVGFGLTLPDVNQPLHLAYPRPGKPEALMMLQLAWHWKVRRKVDWIRVFALGVLPEYRAQGVDALMYLETAKRAIAKGYGVAEMSWILENNDMMNRGIRMMGGKVYKTYRIFQKPLQAPGSH